jgi:hypothetical protein
MLTLDEVTDEVERIREIADDDEVAHNKEDALHQKVLKAIAAAECADPAACAAAALRTLEIEFSRWCA